MLKFAAGSTKGGMITGMPDVCKTPAAPSPIPTPYPNIAQVNTADKVAKKVLLENKETVVESSEVPRSSGDEAGTLKGVVSNTNMDKAVFKAYSSKVFAEGKKVVYHTATAGQNGMNSNVPAGTFIQASQSKTFVAT